MSDTATDPIRYLLDPATADDFEVKHAPTITAKPVEGGYQVHIRVGTDEVPHPSESAHWINWIDLRVGDNSIARFDLTHLVTPDITCNIALDPGTEINVISSCNIHGLWGATLALPNA